MKKTASHRVLVIGGGFGGVEVARTIAYKASAAVSVMLVSKKSYFEYYPGLYRVLSSEPPFEVFVPLERLLPKRIVLIEATVNAIDVVAKKITSTAGELEYDTLVIALGSEPSYFNIPGIEEYSLACKSLSDARYLRRELISRINEVHDTGKQLQVAIAGGGPTGVEMAGQIKALFNDESHFHDVDQSKLTISIIQAAPHLVPQLPERVAHAIENRLHMLNINVLLNERITAQNESGVMLANGFLPTSVLVWTAGSQMPQVLQVTAGLTFTARKKVAVDEYLRAIGAPDVYVIGDNADTPNSGLAQTAVHDGAYVGRTISMVLKNKKAKPYKTKKGAYVMPVGRYWGVFLWKNMMITGIIPHIMRYGVDVFYFFARLSFKDFLTLYIKGRLHEK